MVAPAAQHCRSTTQSVPDVRVERTHDSGGRTGCAQTDCVVFAFSP
ncbi:hypothetical protein CZ774_00970 [Frigoribacterium sp. JB110]|nr:hypothetical protein CZ774_00970 [Frigoribacterium sp. JB110]